MHKINTDMTLNVRCCMCPNLDDLENTICPTDPVTPCRFVKQYTDKRGFKYKTMSGLEENNFKGRYQKPEKKGSVGWKCMRQLEWRKSFDEAQSDLNLLAKTKGWKEVSV